MSFLCFDGPRLTNYQYELYEVSAIKGLCRLCMPWKYYLHGTFGRPLIVRLGVWGSESEESHE